MTKERSQVSPQDCWDVAAIYPSLQEWEKDYLKYSEGEYKEFTMVTRFQGRLKDGPKACLECISAVMSIDRALSKLYTYAHLRHDEDTAESNYKKAYEKIRGRFYAFQEKTSWIEPEILQIPESDLETWMQDPLLKDFKVYLYRILRQKPHTLSTQEEKLLSLSSQALSSPSQIFSAYNNADLVFKPVQDSKGEKKEVTHGSYSLYMQSPDRVLRKHAFESMHEGYKSYQHTLAEVLQGHIRSHIFHAKARNYSSCLEASLFPYEIDTKVYHRLVETVKQNIDVMHAYIGFRKQYLKIDKVHGYDMNVPCGEETDWSFSYEEAVDIIIKATEVLGSEYQEVLKKGLLEGRWVDRYENARKRSGAYSSGCYDTYPYILMNYQGTLGDMLTLAHEAGHSMHSWLSHRHQPYQYSHYTIFVAEVASTFNEELVFRYLLKQQKDPNRKRYLLNKKLDMIRATFFRQTLFAEFELTLHSLAEQGIPLTADLIRDHYKKLNHEYYGPDFCHDDLIEYECFRIPHFYSNFYVYQYATGISAALALVENVEHTKSAKSYLEFLSSGSSDHSLNLLKKAGVDMLSSQPAEAVLKQFKQFLEIG